jgi:hypothetical protein
MKLSKVLKYFYELDVLFPSKLDLAGDHLTSYHLHLSWLRNFPFFLLFSANPPKAINLNLSMTAKKG